MRRIFLSFLFALSITSFCFATIRRVNYGGIARAGVDYADLVAAHTASSAGDTIQIYGIVPSATLTKRLIIQGFGYNFDVNNNLQAIGTDAPSYLNGQPSITFDLGSENSVIEGCNFYRLDIQTSNITIRRCFFSGNVIYLRNDLRSINNTSFLGCVLIGPIQMYSNPGNICTNTTIYNCIIGSAFTFYNNGSTGAFINCVTPYNSSALNLNNTGFLVKNCILWNYNASNLNTVWENNFFATALPATLPQGSNNRWSQSWATLFNRLGGTSDNPGYPYDPTFTENYYILKAGSPAINGGFDASNTPSDCGIYGGDAFYRYKLSGVPAIPAIYKLNAAGSAATTNPYNVTISVRSNN